MVAQYVALFLWVAATATSASAGGTRLPSDVSTPRRRQKRHGLGTHVGRSVVVACTMCERPSRTPSCFAANRTPALERRSPKAPTDQVSGRTDVIFGILFFIVVKPRCNAVECRNEPRPTSFCGVCRRNPFALFGSLLEQLVHGRGWALPLGRHATHSMLG